MYLGAGDNLEEKISTEYKCVRLSSWRFLRFFPEAKILLGCGLESMTLATMVVAPR